MPKAIVVDDNRPLAEDLAEILEDEGYQVAVFDDPCAVAAMPDLEFDVALLDVRMPGIDGVELHAKLAATHPDARFILMTAYTEDDRIARAMAAGVRAVLPKPVPLARLLDELPGERAPVLLVEDDSSLAGGLSEVLSAAGYVCEVAGGIAAAEKALAAGEFGAAVVDVRLPDGDGTELARRLSTDPQLAVVLITGFEAEAAQQLVAAELAGRGAFLRKPFPMQSLLRLLAELRSES